MKRSTLAMLRSLLAAALVLPATPAIAQVASDDAIVETIRTSGTRIETPTAVLWVGANTLNEAEAQAFAAALDRGVTAIAGLIGSRLDSAHYGSSRIEVFVGNGIGVSHVYGSYRHMRYNLPYLFLDAEKVRAGEAPYLHEATHLLSWRFGSHSLREGFASWVESRIIADGGASTSGLFGASSPEAVDQQARERIDGPGAEEVLPFIGKNGFADQRVTSPERPRVRAAYYLLSQSFVQHLIREIGLPVFLAVYSSEDPETQLLKTTQRDLAAWKNQWLDALRAQPKAAK